MPPTERLPVTAALLVRVLTAAPFVVRLPDALRLCRSQRSLHPGLGAVHVIALQRAIAVTADCADTLELVRGNLHLRIEQAQIMDCACVFPEQTKIFCVIGNRGLIQLEMTDDIPAGKHAGNAVQQTACAVQLLRSAGILGKPISLPPETESAPRAAVP